VNRTLSASTMGASTSRATMCAAAVLVLTLGAAGHANAGTDGSLRKSAATPTAAAASKMNSRGVAGTQSAYEQWHDANLGALTEAAWRWLVSLPVDATPFADESSVNCGLNQQGRFWFLGGPIGATFSRTCTIPAGRAIVVAVNAFLNDYPCPDPTFKPAPGQSLEEFLQSFATFVIDNVVEGSALLDGKAVPVRRVATGAFSFTGAADWNSLDACITGSPQLGASDGYWVTLDPLPVGEHTLILRSTSLFFGSSEGTYTLKIRK
jgi:hypothetical protein